ncbi:hypothetical protein KDH_24950 [Dictyobacter sp. S3.2.2.5]|uniref:Uncharacterized protein n=1 Tax=Dictyobacter halimunensis TaxID=3026934 RepID=A0ABQ6FN22_9CHLR|nr:hypothetical protein KDH_24950 [Dictyobacter sp. S3.2.2.5]
MLITSRRRYNHSHSRNHNHSYNRSRNHSHSHSHSHCSRRIYSRSCHSDGGYNYSFYYTRHRSSR